MYFLLQIILVVMSYDIHFYYFHRALHTRWLYPYHKKHHEYTYNVSAMATFHASKFENYFSGIGIFYPYLLFSQVSIYAVIVGSFICMIKGIIRHDPKLIKLPILRIFFSDHHIIHHYKTNCNYGSWWIDTLHQTTYKKINY